MSTPKPESPFALGTEVIVTNGNWPGRREKATITKVGRTNVYITRWGREKAFDKFTGFEKRGSNVGGLADRIRTEGMIEADERRDALVSEAGRLGLQGTYRTPAYSNETLEAVIEILKADPAAPKQEDSK